MSLETREALINSGHLFPQNPSQFNDLLDDTKTQTTLIAFLQHMVEGGFYIELTSVKSDHSDDSDLGEFCHFNGFCVDCWPLNTPKAGDYMDENIPRFQSFLEYAAKAPYFYQTGLGGAADTPANRIAAGPTVFNDNDEDHVHFGTHWNNA